MVQTKRARGWAIRTTARERSTYDDRTRRRKPWTEFRLLGYQVEYDWVLLRLGQTGRRLWALTDVYLVHIQPGKK